MSIKVGDLDFEGLTFLGADNAVVVGVKMSRAAVEDADEDEEGEEGEEGEGGEAAPAAEAAEAPKEEAAPAE